MQDEAVFSRRVRAACRAEIHNLSAWLNRLPPYHPARADLERALAERERELARVESRLGPAPPAPRPIPPAARAFENLPPLRVRDEPEPVPRVSQMRRLAEPVLGAGRATKKAAADLVNIAGQAASRALQIPKGMWMASSGFLKSCGAICAGAVRAAGAKLGGGLGAVARVLTVAIVAAGAGVWRVLSLPGRITGRSAKAVRKVSASCHRLYAGAALRAGAAARGSRRAVARITSRVVSATVELGGKAGALALSSGKRARAAAMNGAARGFAFCREHGRRIAAIVSRQGRMAVRKLRFGAAEGLRRARGAWSDAQPKAARAAFGLLAWSVVAFATIYDVSANAARRAASVVRTGSAAAGLRVRAAIPKIANGVARTGREGRSVLLGFAAKTAKASTTGGTAASAFARKLRGRAGLAASALIDRHGPAIARGLSSARTRTGAAVRRTRSFARLLVIAARTTSSAAFAAVRRGSAHMLRREQAPVKDGPVTTV